MAASAVRYCQSTLSRGGPCSIIFSPSTSGSPVRWGSRWLSVAHPASNRTLAHRPDQRSVLMGTNPATEPHGAPSSRLPVGRILQALLLHLRGVFPDDLAGARIDQLERVKDIVTGAGLSASRHAFEFAGEEEVSSFELLNRRVGGRRDLARAFHFTFFLQRRHPIASQEDHFAL